MPDSADQNRQSKLIAIACGGTGGHLFPGVAVGEELRLRGCNVMLMVSPKEVDQHAVQSITGMEIVTLPAVGWNRKGGAGFLWGLWKSYGLAKRHFRRCQPECVLAMGGFVSAPPVIAGKNGGAKTFLHESNSIPGRANRWLAPRVDGAFVYFSSATDRLQARRVEVAGMPVRPQFCTTLTTGEARQALGFTSEAPLLLAMGGSQGAARVNELVLKTVPQLRKAIPELQVMHLTGLADFEKVRAGYAAQNVPARVHAFFDEMGTALAAADVAVSRAGASSLAELAARQLPGVLIPYPSAADNHQHFNARAFAQTGAARMLQQETVTADQLAGEILNLLRSGPERSAMQRALAAWHKPEAAAQIAEKILHWSGQLGDARHAAEIKLKALSC